MITEQQIIIIIIISTWATVFSYQKHAVDDAGNEPPTS